MLPPKNFPHWLPCPLCGLPALVLCQPAEEVWIDTNVGHVVAVTRHSRGSCHLCGLIWSWTLGHHGSTISSKLKKVFPPRVRLRIKEALPAADSRTFDQAWRGFWIPSKGQLEQWAALAWPAAPPENAGDWRDLLALARA